MDDPAAPFASPRAWRRRDIRPATPASALPTLASIATRFETTVQVLLFRAFGAAIHFDTRSDDLAAPDVFSALPGYRFRGAPA
jgi:hypothetical protein